eukprot:4667212-Karenia_brevis.AAC.1
MKVTDVLEVVVGRVDTASDTALGAHRRPERIFARILWHCVGLRCQFHCAAMPIRSFLLDDAPE